jgi:hypothetical protein
VFLVSLSTLITNELQALTQRELLNLHAEVKTLQFQHGLSYKDAAHRLYHAEVQKVTTLGELKSALEHIHEDLDNAIGDAAEDLQEDLQSDD